MPEHECVALIGASGSGKSTLLRCINLLEVVDDGTVTLEGRDITDPRVDADEVRTGVGIVFQAFNLFPHMSVLDNVTLAPRKVHGIRREHARRRDALAMLDRVGLADRASGQARSVVRRATAAGRHCAGTGQPAAVMLFDEVTSALDPELVGEVLDLLAELKNDGMTMLVATHEMGFARMVADQVVFLADGVVAEAGPPEQVLGDPVDPRTQRFLRRIIDAGRL